MTVATVAEIQLRLGEIFPPGTENRNYLTREICARTVFVALYVGAVEGRDRWIRPNQVCRMSDAQAGLLDEASRENWYSASLARAYKSIGHAWFADNTREPIRDETIKGGLIPTRAMLKRPGLPTTSSLPSYQLDQQFAMLFDAALTGETFRAAAAQWRESHLSKAALSRQQLLSSGVVAAGDSVRVSFPGGDARSLSAGPSSVLAKASIEDFAVRFLRKPLVLWLSESGNKVVARDEALAEMLGLKIDPQSALPDLILVDLGRNADGSEFLFVFVELVASDGPINRQRKEALTALAKEAGMNLDRLAFVTVFMDRGGQPFRRAISELAWGSYAWLASEPEHLISLHDGREVALASLS